LCLSAALFAAMSTSAGMAAEGKGVESANLSTLTTAEQIRELTHDQANRGYPVRLRAVVTYNDPATFDYFVQDSTAGIYINDLNGQFRFKPGQLIEIEGVTEEPDFAPQVGKPRYRVLGEAPLPKAPKATLQDLASTRYDSQWVEFDGIVHEATQDQGHLTLQLGAVGDDLPAYILTTDDPAPARLVDARVRIRGVCASIFNSKNQLTGVRLVTPDSRQLTVEEPAPADPFSIPLRSLGTVLSFVAHGTSEHRIRVRGTVTLQRPRGVFIQDGGQGLYIPAPKHVAVNPGDSVSVVGFADVGDYTPVLRHALVLKTGGAPLPAPLSVNATQLLTGAFDTLRVTLDATLRDQRRSEADHTLVLQDGGVLFEARLAVDKPFPGWPSFVPGSRLRLTGVCSVDVGPRRVPEGFAILLNSPADVTVLARPSWWTLRNTSVVLALLALLTLAVLVWVGVLRHRVKQQTETIRRRLENEAALEKRFHYVARATNDVIWDWDLLTQAVWWSDNLRAAFQHAPGQVGPDARWWHEHIHPEDRARVEASLQAVVAAGGEKWSGEYRFRRAGGEYAYVFDRGYFMYDDAGRPVRALGAMMDVSDRKRADVQLADERNLLRTLIDNVPDLIYVRDTQDRLLVVNVAAARLVGARSPEELLGKTNSDLFPEERARRYYAENRRVWETGQALLNFEERMVDSEGHAAWILVTKVPLRDADGKIVGMVGVGHDITSRKQAEEEIERARAAAEAASRAKSEFLANMSHEIRTPMNGILGMTDLALETELSAEQRQYLEAVKVSGDALLTVINDILDFSKIEAGKLELCPIAFNLWTTLEHTVRSMAAQAHRKGLELVCEIHAQAPEFVVGDPARLRQIVTNLLGNAVKFTEQGEVVLEVQLEAPSADGIRLHFVVRDTGIGVPPAKRTAIFDAFEQADGSAARRFGGTGLGLTISERLVRMMGGRIWVKSEEGRGSQFHFTAQFGAAAAPNGNETRELQPPALAGVPVLVVDDNASSRCTLQGILTTWGMDVEPAEDAGAALAALRTARAAGRPFRLVMADVQMPGTDGFALAAEIKRDPELGQATILMLTSAGQRGDAARCRALGVAAYLTKPIPRSELRTALLGALDHQPQHVPAPLVTVHSLREERRTARILVAEDNAVNRILVVRLLEKHGYGVAVAANGREALAALETGPFDLVLMDLQMPEMDGFEVTAAIRERERRNGQHLPIVAITAHAMKGDRERCLEVGMDDYVSKPICAADLLRTIEAQLAPEPDAALQEVG